MASDWQDLTQLTQGAPLVVERVRIAGKALRVEGEFELPPLARLAAEDQVFVAAFVRSHGSIKEMERLFGISYPTVKARLNRIASQLQLGDVAVRETPADVLGRLERGEISVEEAIGRIQKGKQGDEA